MSWQFVMGILILYSIIIVPLRLGFDYDAEGGWLAWELIIDGLFFLDIILNFRTAFYDEEKMLVYDKRTIMVRYAKGWFIVDFISTVPFDELAAVFAKFSTTEEDFDLLPTKLLRLVRIVRLLKLARLVKLSRVFGRIREVIQLSPSFERFMRLLVMMSLFCHWNACLFHVVMLHSESAENWCADLFMGNSKGTSTSPDDCEDASSIADRYIAALYWAFTTLTTVGYGDVKPNMYSESEIALVIILIVINSTIFAYILTSVINLIRNLDPYDREYKLLMTEMKDYLRDSNVGSRVCHLVKMHYQHHLSTLCLFPEKQIFDKMSPSLRFEAARLVASETLLAIPLITVMEDSFKGFVSYALFLLQPMCVARTEIVCHSGGAGSEMFFLVEGECDLVNTQTGQGRVIGENAVFEQYSLMVAHDEIYRTVSRVTAISPKCLLYSLSCQDFRALEYVSPAVSTYFVSQLAAVLVEDDFFTLNTRQRENVEAALRRGQVFHAVAEQAAKAQPKVARKKTHLGSITEVALAAQAAKQPMRRKSEWSPDLLSRHLHRIADEDNREEDQQGSSASPPTYEQGALHPNDEASSS